MRKKLSFRIYFLLLCVISMVMMLLQGIAGMFGGSRSMYFVEAAVSFGLAAFVLVRSKAEPQDELARKNLGKAAYGTVLFTLIVLLVIWLYLVITNRPVILRPSDLFFAMSALFLSLGVQFFAFDKWGKA